jgi:hypothetical protein
MNNTDISIRSRVIETRPFDWKSFKFIQQDDFKEHNAIDKARLKNSLLTNGFIAPFYAWEHEGVVYCLDGKHRSLDLELLITEGVDVPELLDTTFLRLDSIEQAAKMVLLFSSHYAQITKNGLSGFIDMYNLNIDILLDEISLPDMPLIEPPVLPIPDDLISDGRNKPSTLKITFESVEDAERAMPMIDKLIKEHFKNAFFSVSSGEI